MKPGAKSRRCMRGRGWPTSTTTPPPPTASTSAAGRGRRGRRGDALGHGRERRGTDDLVHELRHLTLTGVAHVRRRATDRGEDRRRAVERVAPPADHDRERPRDRALLAARDGCVEHRDVLRGGVLGERPRRARRDRARVDHEEARRRAHEETVRTRDDALDVRRVGHGQGRRPRSHARPGRGTAAVAPTSISGARRPGLRL